MIQAIAGVLSPDAVAGLRKSLGIAAWIDGNATSGHQSARAKRNRQLDEDDPRAQAAGKVVLDALAGSARFVAAALPLKVYPPLFNRYAEGDGFGPHVDAAIRIRRGSDFRLRTDLSATLFLSDVRDYDGGELVVETGFGTQSARLGAGDLLLYPASSVHHVSPVTRGTRLAAFFWVQSMVRDDAARAILFDLDEGIQALAQADEAARVRLTAVYHNLLRRFADA